MRMKRFPHIFPKQVARAVCFFCATVLLSQTVLTAQHKSNRLRPRYLSNSPPDPERGREILANARSIGLPGDYFFEFDLEVLPRRGARSVLPGKMWGSRNEFGPTFRADLGTLDDANSERVLAQNGRNPRSWRYVIGEAGAGVIEFDDATIMDSIGGTGLTMFELQMPFVYWADYIYEGTTEVRGRAVHAFLMYPPESFAAVHPHIAGVRLHLDASFHALMQAVILGKAEEPSRKLTVMDLKKLGKQWIIKSIDVRDEKTRDKVRFKVTGAALDLDFSPQLFAPESLSVPIDSPADVQKLRW